MKILKPTLFIATAALLLVSCGQSSSTATGTLATDSTTIGTPDSYNGKIAFIRMDSLRNGYGMFIDESDEFGKKSQKAETELASRGRALQQEAIDLNDKMQKGLVTRYQAETTGKTLQKKEQDLMAYRDRKSNELAEEQAVLSAKIAKTVLDYLKEYNLTHKYSMIIQTEGSMPVVLADPSLDITADVLAELNRRYEATITTKK